MALALALGAISPGPCFIMVARTSLSVSRYDGLAAACGMGVGAVLFALAALLGMIAVLTAAPWLHLALRFFGGAYLLFLACRFCCASPSPLLLDNSSPPRRLARPGRSFLLGLATQLSNPKTAIVYASVFASLLPRPLPGFMLAVLPAMVFAIETGWYGVVALALSAAAPRARYLAAKSWLDRAAGAVMAVLGLRLMLWTPEP